MSLHEPWTWGFDALANVVEKPRRWCTVDETMIKRQAEPGFLDEFTRPRRKLAKGRRWNVSDHGHQQARLRIHGDADVNVFVQNNLTVLPARVQQRVIG